MFLVWAVVNLKVRHRHLEVLGAPLILIALLFEVNI